MLEKVLKEITERNFGKYKQRTVWRKSLLA